MRPEYDFDYAKGVRGKYYARLLREGTNVVVLDPDVASAFGDSAAVNEALRSLLDLSRATERLTPPDEPTTQEDSQRIVAAKGRP